MDRLSPDLGELDREQFREVIGHFASGVTVITTRAEGCDYGMTASAVSSLSLDPPMLLACLNDSSPTQQAVSRSGAFGVNVLAAGQHDVALHFARRSEDKFAGVPTHRGGNDVPLLDEALAVFECQVTHAVKGGTHRVYLARVERARARVGSPLAYFRGNFGQFELDAHAGADALAAVRRFVITRQVPLDTPIDLAATARALELSTAHIHLALLTLESEGLVTRLPGGELVVTPVDRTSAHEAFAARTAIELGAAELAVGRVAREDLEALRRHADATGRLVVDGRFTDTDAYVAANAAFHEHLVALAGSPALVEAYRRLSIPTLMALLLSHLGDVVKAPGNAHHALTDAYELGEIDRVRDAIVAHAHQAEELNEAVIVASGGRV